MLAAAELGKERTLAKKKAFAEALDAKAPKIRGFCCPDAIETAGLLPATETLTRRSATPPVEVTEYPKNIASASGLNLVS